LRKNAPAFDNRAWRGSQRSSLAWRPGVRSLRLDAVIGLARVLVEKILRVRAFERRAAVAKRQAVAGKADNNFSPGEQIAVDEKQQRPAGGGAFGVPDQNFDGDR